ncbi:hypothetical protein LTR95_000889 [Oleoguttula sp. CCFEE 5521]
MGTRYKLVFFAPAASIEAIKKAIFAAGAGQHDGYTECCFTTPGTGQFVAGQMANPAIGRRGILEMVEEVRCETSCVGSYTTKRVVEALKKAHPYEVPVYEVIKLEDF